MNKAPTTGNEFLAAFTRREDALLARAKAANVELPERLKDWRLWVGDSQIYLAELRAVVEKAEQNKPSGNKAAPIVIPSPALVGSTIWFEHEGKKYVAQIMRNDRPSVVGAEALYRKIAGTISPVTNKGETK